MKQGRDGFLLVELMVAFVMATLLALLSFAWYGNMVATRHQAMQYERALLYAQMILEQSGDHCESGNKDLSHNARMHTITLPTIINHDGLVLAIPSWLVIREIEVSGSGLGAIVLARACIAKER